MDHGNGHAFAVSSRRFPEGRAHPSNQAAEDHRSHPEEMAWCLLALQIT